MALDNSQTTREVLGRWLRYSRARKREDFSPTEFQNYKARAGSHFLPIFVWNHQPVCRGPPSYQNLLCTFLETSECRFHSMWLKTHRDTDPKQNQPNKPLSKTIPPSPQTYNTHYSSFYQVFVTSECMFHSVWSRFGVGIGKRSKPLEKTFFKSDEFPSENGSYPMLFISPSIWDFRVWVSFHWLRIWCRYQKQSRKSSPKSIKFPPHPWTWDWLARKPFLKRDLVIQFTGNWFKICNIPLFLCTSQE